MSKKTIGTIFYHAFMILFGFAMLYPLLWMVFSSFKDSADIFSTAAQLIPKTFKFSNYVTGWRGMGSVTFATYYRNSLLISILATVGVVFSSAVVSFGFGRLRFKGKGFWFICMMISMMLPYQVIMIPQFIIFNKLKWVGTFLPLIVPHFFGGGFFIFLCIQFIQGLPREMDEAAKIDGCSPYATFARIIFPLLAPAVVTSAIFSFIWRWEDFLAALLYLNKPQLYTISIGLKMFADPTAQSDYGALFAMSSLSLVPVFLVFLFFQRYLVEGISVTGMKG